MRVDVLALDGALDAALGVTLDILAAANRLCRSLGRPTPFAVRVVSRRRFVRTGTGRRLQVDALARAGQRPQALVVLGMNVPTPRELGAALLRSDVRAAIESVRRHHARGALVCAACSATFLCAEAGILDGRDATTSWWLAPHFRGRYPRVRLREEAMVVAAGRVVTAGAALSQVDLMLWLVRRQCGPQVAQLCARFLVVDERSSQAGYLVLGQLAHASEEVARAEAFARAALHRRIGVAELARAAAVSERTLERRFQETLGLSPMRFLQRLRVERAVHLAQTTRDSLSRIAARVGYEDAVSLRRIVRRETGRPLSSVRRRAARAPGR